MSYTISNEMTRTEFQQVLRDDRVTIVKASAPWCGPCKKIAGFVDELFALMSSNVQLMKLDVDDNTEVSNYLRIRKLPTFISFVGKDKMDILEGADQEKVKRFFVKVETRARLLRQIAENNI